MLYYKIKSFLKDCGFQDIEPEEFDIIEGEQESWRVNGFILTHIIKDQGFILEKVIPISGTYEDPPCEDYEQVGQTFVSVDDLLIQYMKALAYNVIEQRKFEENLEDRL